MALISCSKCGKQMSDKAPACPHCGAAPASAQPVQPVQPVQAAQPVQPVQTAQPVQPVYTAPPVQPAAAYGGEQFEQVLIKGKKSNTGMIVCSVLACLLWIACIVLLGCVIYDYSYADSIAGIIYFSLGDYPPDYYSILAGGEFREQYWLIIELAAAAVLALAGTVIFIAGFGRRLNVTNAGVVIKRPFRPSVRLTWDRIERAAKETDTSFVVFSENKKYRLDKLGNCGEVFGVITDMLSRKSSGMLKMPAVYGVKSTLGKLLRKKTPLIAAAAVIAVVIAAAVLTPVFMRLGAKQVENVPYEWSIKELYSFGGLDAKYKVIEKTFKGTYSGEWLNGKPYGTGTIKFDGTFCGYENYTGTWKNGEPRKGTLYTVYTDITYEGYSGEFRHSRLYGQGRYTNNIGIVSEGEFKNNGLYNGTITYLDGTVETITNGRSDYTY